MPVGEDLKYLKRKIRGLLEASDYGGLVSLSREKRQVLRLLISMTYDKADVTSWRASEAIGRITAAMPDEKVRNIIQRLLWMMREESGTNPWSAAEVIGEILRANPGPFEDIVPVVISFHEEEFLRKGALWAMKRIAEARPDLVEPFDYVPTGYLKSGGPGERGLSILVLAALGKEDHVPLIEKSLNDNAPVVYYEGGDLIEKPIRALASEALGNLKKGN
jgi:HEAT repeat protein